MLNTHEPTACEGQPCCIHNPTDHHMAHIRATRGEGLAWGQGVHGCDGCCKPTIPGLAPASHGYANGGYVHSGVDADHPPAWADSSYIVPKR